MRNFVFCLQISSSKWHSPLSVYFGMSVRFNVAGWETMHERRAGPRCHRYVSRPRHCGGAELRPESLYSHASCWDSVDSSSTAKHYRSKFCPRLSCHTSHDDCVRVHSVYAGNDYHNTSTCQSSIFSTYDSRRDLDQIDNAQYVIEIFFASCLTMKSHILFSTFLFLLCLFRSSGDS